MTQQDQSHRWGWRLLSLLLLASGGLAFWGLTQTTSTAATDTGQAAPVLVQTTQTRLADQSPVLSQTGFTRADRAVSLAFQVSGQVAWVSPDFRVGRMVEQGDVIAQLETRRIQTRISQAEAERDRAQAQLDEADATLQRTEILQERDVSSTASLDDAKAARATAQAGLSIANANLEAARVDLADAELRAPFAGIVASTDLAEGQVVQPGAPVGRLIDATRAQVYLSLSQQQLDSFDARGGPLEAKVRIHATSDTARHLRDGEVVDIVPEVTEGVRLTNLIVTFPDPFTATPSVQMGQLVRVDIPIAGGTDLIAFTSAALRGDNTVWVIADDNTLQERSVDIVYLSDDTVYATPDTLAQDTTLLTTDLTNPTDGMAVRPSAPDTASAEALQP